MKARSRILLISNSTVHGRGYLDHVENEIKNFSAPRERFCFSRSRCLIAMITPQRQKRGLRRWVSHSRPRTRSTTPQQRSRRPTLLFIGGGNTFRLVESAPRSRLLEPIRRKVRKRSTLHRQQRRLQRRRSNNQNDQGHANRPAAFFRFVRLGPISDQSALSRPRSEFHTHG